MMKFVSIKRRLRPYGSRIIRLFGVGLFACYVSCSMMHAALNVGAIVQSFERINSWKGRHLPCWFGGVSRQQVDQVINAYQRLGKEDQDKIKLNYIIRTGNFLNDEALETITYRDIIALINAGRLPSLKGMHQIRFMHDLAYAFVVQQPKKIIERWDSTTKTAEPVKWVTLMPALFRHELACYFRAYMIKRGWDYWLFGDSSFHFTLEHGVRMEIIPLPNAIGSYDVFASLNAQDKINRYVDSLVHYETSLSQDRSKRAVETMLRYMPQDVVLKITQEYARRHDFQDRVGLLAEGRGLDKITWGISLSSYVTNPVVKRLMQQKITSYGCVDISDEHITSIPRDSFSSFHSLDLVKKLIVSSKMLESIDRDSFAGMTSLEEIVIRGTSLKTLPAGLFAHNIHVKKIVISHNKHMTLLPVDLFMGIDGIKLDVVDLTGNMLTEDGLPYFGGLAVTSLVLSGNQLRTLYEKTFMNNARGDVSHVFVRSVRELWLNANKLSFEVAGNALKDALHYCIELRGLHAADNKFTSSALQYIASLELPHLVYLSLAGNKEISHLHVDASMRPMEQLRVLDVSRCGIVAFEPHHFNVVHNLHILDARSNRLTTFGERQRVFEMLKHLKILHLGDNHIERITGSAFHGLYDLKELYLEGNQISLINQGAFRDLKNLEVLVAFGNNHRFSWNEKFSDKGMSVEKDVFSGLSHVTYLDMSFNGISHVYPGMFAGCRSLQVLGLGNNALRELKNDTFNGALALQEIDLSGNNITHVEINAFRGLTKACRKVYFKGNNAFGLMSYLGSLRPYFLGGCAASFEKSWNHTFLFAGLSRILSYLSPSHYGPFMKVVKRNIAQEKVTPREFDGYLLEEYERVYKKRREFYTQRVVQAQSKVEEHIC